MSASPPPEAAPAPAQAELYNQVFGGEGSDISDDSGDEDGQRRPRGRLAFPKRPAAEGDDDGETAPALAIQDDVDVDVDDEKDEDEDEQYVPATATSSAKIPKFKRTKRHSGDEDDADEDDEEDVEEDEEERRRQRKKKKQRAEASRKRRDRSEGDIDVDEDEEAAPIIDAETQRRLEIEQRIDAIGKKAKVVRRKKKGGEDDGDIVDSYHDEVCARLRDRMIAAADKDEASNRSKLPGTAKLAMLDEVMGVLRNTTLWQSIVDNGVLEAVKRWLEPLPDRSLPSVGIQKAIFEVLPKMDLDTTTLKECRLGPIVLFYTKTKRVTPAINRQADALVQSWSRPIIKRPANFRSKFVGSQNEVESQPHSQGESQSRGGGYNQSQGDDAAPRKKRFDIQKALEENATRKGARLQIVKDIQYTVAPESRTQHLAEEMQHVSRIQLDNKKFNKFARQMKGGRGGR
ncbi:hypothetical protein IAR55_000888 [Kwoniella newhampshirensis]|uniref:TFIIS N-terminal domain-containing protein n=1 Tax=Kwoniella newhampshirensis TaxID=1651941 RepID=A0AAW0Z488_9TREE